MKHSFKKSLMFIMVTLAFLVNAFGVKPAFADDESPPPPIAEEPALPPVEESSLPPVVVTEADDDATPDPGAPEESAPTESLAVAELLSEVPENTEIVALDSDGESLPLVSQDAADVVAEADPKWCPESVLPNGISCSANFPSIAGLLAHMQANSTFYSKHGVIYFERTSLTTFTSSFVLDESLGSLGASYNTLKEFNITLTGGWAGGTSNSLSSSSLFNDPAAFIQVGTSSNPWMGNVSLNNIQIGTAGTTGIGVSTNNSLTIYTSDGDITLKNVDVKQQQGGFYTGYLQSGSGNITIGPNNSGNHSSFDGNNSTGKVNKGFFAITESGTISITDTTFQNASGGAAANYNGATLSAPHVDLANVTAKYNDGSGIFVNGIGSTIVNVYGGTFSNNKGYGLELTGSILNEHIIPACNGNTSGCYNASPNATPMITVNNVTVEADIPGGWKLALNTIGSATDTEDGIPSIDCTPALGSLLPVGTSTIVSCAVEDSGGLTATDSGTVHVVDTAAPVLSLPANMTFAATSPAGTIVTYAVSAIDIVAGPVSVSCSPFSGSVFRMGTTVVNCSAVDGSGNTAQGGFNVTIKDTGAPILTVPANISIAVHHPGDAIVSYSASATDFIEGPLPVTCVPASGSTFPEGITVVECSATDRAVNTSTGSFSVTVDLDKLPKTPLFSIVELKKGQLPSQLGQGQTFGSALKLEFLKQGPKGGVTLSFPIPAGMQESKLSVMYWDGSKWVAMSGGSVAGDYFVLEVTKPGSYTLVGQ